MSDPHHPAPHAPAPHTPAPAPNPHHPSAPAPQPAPAVVPAAPAAVAAPTPASVGVKAISARAFLDSLGVNTHLNYYDTPYGNVGAVWAALDYTGLRRIRDGYIDGAKDRYATIAQRGVGLNFYLPGKVDLKAHVAQLEAFQKNHPGAIVSLEGSNEVNFWPTPFNGKTDLASQAAIQKEWFDAAKASPVLGKLPVSNLTLGGVGDAAHKQLGDMRGFCDLANVHMYFGAGGQPIKSWDYAWGLGQIPAAGKPGVITETGYPTAPLNRAIGVDEVTQAKQTLNLFCRAAMAGVAQTYLYELVDQKRDPTKTDREANHGLFRNDWTPKPAATAIRNLTTILGGPAASGGSLAYSVAGLPANGQQQLFQTSSGYAVAIWAEPDIWDEVSNKPIPAPVFDVKVTLPKAMAFETFDPLVSSVAMVAGTSAAVSVRVSDHPVIVRVT